MSGYIVKLQDGCWLSGGQYVVCVRKHAKIFKTESAAKAALTRKRRMTQRAQSDAKIEFVDGDL